MRLRFSITANVHTEWEATEENLGKTPEEYMAEARKPNYFEESDVYDEFESISAEKGMSDYVYTIDLINDAGQVVDTVRITKSKS